MARKKRSKLKISLETVLVLLVLALIAAIVCYFAVPSFKKTVDDYLQSVFNKDDHGTNAAKGESELRVHYLDVGQGGFRFNRISRRHQHAYRFGRQK